jgi:hypothetical protein
MQRQLSPLSASTVRLIDNFVGVWRGDSSRSVKTACRVTTERLIYSETTPFPEVVLSRRVLDIIPLFWLSGKSC